MTVARRIGAGLGALALGVAVTIGSPTAALAVQAANMIAYQGDDYGTLFKNNPNGGQVTVYACDKEQDGNGVYVQVKWSGGGTYGKVGDGNGSAEGCGKGVLNGYADSIRVCEDDLGDDSCGTWRNTYP